MSNSEQRLPLIAEDLHTEFKTVCVEKRISMKEGAKEAISDFIKKQKKEANKNA